VADPISLIPAAEWRRRDGGISQSTEHRRVKHVPGYPHPVIIGGRRFYFEHEGQAYLRALAESAPRGKAEVAHGISDTDETVGRACRAGGKVEIPIKPQKVARTELRARGPPND
jgi:hypothetical protein